MARQRTRARKLTRKRLYVVAVLSSSEQRKITVVPQEYPESSLEGRQQFRALCEEAATLATAAWRGEANLKGATRIAHALLGDYSKGLEIARIEKAADIGQRVRGGGGKPPNKRQPEIIACARVLLRENPKRWGLAARVLERMPDLRLSERQVARILKDSDIPS